LIGPGRSVTTAPYDSEKSNFESIGWELRHAHSIDPHACPRALVFSGPDLRAVRGVDQFRPAGCNATNGYDATEARHHDAADDNDAAEAGHDNPDDARHHDAWLDDTRHDDAWHNDAWLDDARLDDARLDDARLDDAWHRLWCAAARHAAGTRRW
jgi:hypothetical protein